MISIVRTREPKVIQLYISRMDSFGDQNDTVLDADTREQFADHAILTWQFEHNRYPGDGAGSIVRGTLVLVQDRGCVSHGAPAGSRFIIKVLEGEFERVGQADMLFDGDVTVEFDQARLTALVNEVKAGKRSHEPHRSSQLAEA
jgi:hypothetical protein